MESYDAASARNGARLTNKIGSIRLEPSGEGTHAVWTSTFELHVPAITGAASAAFAPIFSRGFGRVLADVDRAVSV